MAWARQVARPADRLWVGKLEDLVTERTTRLQDASLKPLAQGRRDRPPNDGRPFVLESASVVRNARAGCKPGLDPLGEGQRRDRHAPEISCSAGIDVLHGTSEI